MAATIADVPVTFSDWVDINTVSGITVGVAMTIQNKSTVWVHLIEQVTKPTLDATDGLLLTNVDNAYAITNIPTGAIRVWARTSESTRTAKLSVQVA